MPLAALILATLLTPIQVPEKGCTQTAPVSCAEGLVWDEISLLCLPPSA